MCDSPRLSDYGNPEQCIGRGAFGSVYLYKQPNRDVAIKKISLPQERYACMYANPNKVDEEYEESLASLINEATAYAYLDSPYIIRPHAIACGGLQMGIVMPLARQDLTNVLYKGHLTAIEKKNILAQVGRGLFDAHMTNILNLDLKSCNILFMRDGTIKIADWGKAQLEFCSHPHISHWDAGTVNYNPPEKLLDFEQRTPAFDVWSFGVLVYVIHFNQLIFEGDDPEEVLNSMIKELGPLPPEMQNQYHSEFNSRTPRAGHRKIAAIESDQIADLLRMIFVFDPAERPTMRQVLKHPYFIDCSEIVNIQETPRAIRLSNRIARQVTMPNQEIYSLRRAKLQKLLYFANRQDINSETIHLAVNLYDHMQNNPLLVETDLNYILVTCLYLSETLTSAEACEVTTYRRLMPSCTINVTRVFELALIIGQLLNWKLAPTTSYHWFEFFKIFIPNSIHRKLIQKILLLLNLTQLPFKYTSLDIVLTTIAWGQHHFNLDHPRDPIFDTKIIDINLAQIYHTCQDRKILMAIWPSTLKPPSKNMLLNHGLDGLKQDLRRTKSD